MKSTSYESSTLAQMNMLFCIFDCAFSISIFMASKAYGIGLRITLHQYDDKICAFYGHRENSLTPRTYIK